jgi:hypothetical protein
MAPTKALIGAAKCDVTSYHYEFKTTGGAGEPTITSGAIMVPSGAGCTGALPMVLYAHGTSTTKNYNISSFPNKFTTLAPANDAESEGVLVAETYAAQGFIVVAPNYAGYDTSTLSYHPYLNQKQQAQEMIDALTAARTALATLPLPAASITGASTLTTLPTDSGKLFITGYSQGGYVGMATAKAMQAAGMTVTAVGTSSGPYAMAAFGDALFGGNVDVGATAFAPLLITSYQKAYGNLYSSVTEAINPLYASGIETLLPNALEYINPANPADPATLVGSGKLPFALFQSGPTGYSSVDQNSPVNDATGTMVNPVGNAALNRFAPFFDPTHYLINSSYRLGYLADVSANPDGAVPTPTTYMPAAAPTNPVRQALKKNDLRGYIPTMPVLMCGGYTDPTVFYQVNTSVMTGILKGALMAGAPVNFAVVDLDGNGAFGPADPAYAAAGNNNFLASPYATAANTALNTNLPNPPYPANTTLAKLLQSQFQQQMGGIAGGPGGMNAFLAAYHSTAAPFCAKATQAYFSQF